MRFLIANLWNLYDAGAICCITTNGYVKKQNGEAVMGCGVAKQACKRIPGLARTLGMLLTAHGNCVQLIGCKLWAFPVKPDKGLCGPLAANVVPHMRSRFQPGEWVPGWALKASLSLIARSLNQLKELREGFQWSEVYLPKPGCGAGGLDWEIQVRPLCEEFGDWLVVIDRS